MSRIYSAYQKLIGMHENFNFSNSNVQVTGDAASDIIRNKILSDEPFMVSRFGSNELNCILNYHYIQGGIFKNILHIAGGIPYFMHLKKGVVENMNLVAGFFPATEKNIARFYQLTLTDISEIDVLGSWLGYEKYLYKYFQKNHTRIQLEDLSPFTHSNPWSSALAGKKVLVIHPFEDTILAQYKKRELLFADKNVLPAFELSTMKSVQSIANTKTAYKDWFEALDFMKKEVSQKKFDIAIIGCGAYGMPLAAHIKRMGKGAIHIGGAVQCLFGIKGKRWEIPFYNYQEKFYNKYWMRPLETEKPKDAHKAEEAAYW